MNKNSSDTGPKEIKHGTVEHNGYCFDDTVIVRQGTDLVFLSKEDCKDVIEYWEQNYD